MTAVVFLTSIATVFPDFRLACAKLWIARIGSGTLGDAARLARDWVIVSHQTIHAMTFRIGTACCFSAASCRIAKLRIFRETVISTPLRLSASRLGTGHAFVEVLVVAAGLINGTVA